MKRGQQYSSLGPGAGKAQSFAVTPVLDGRIREKSPLSRRRIALPTLVHYPPAIDRLATVRTRDGLIPKTNTSFRSFGSSSS
ncbi:hypothetical protein SBA2_320045 [Acidobacteriia bacterium SbA2]|nr:hypothetical protein SBA2_320045 [Acidobacteriia bacterium SbA2]